MHKHHSKIWNLNEISQSRKQVSANRKARGGKIIAAACGGVIRRKETTLS
jgi:hypothetical protein